MVHYSFCNLRAKGSNIVCLNNHEMFLCALLSPDFVYVQQPVQLSWSLPCLPVFLSPFFFSCSSWLHDLVWHQAYLNHWTNQMWEMIQRSGTRLLQIILWANFLPGIILINWLHNRNQRCEDPLLGQNTVEKSKRQDRNTCAQLSVLRPPFLVCLKSEVIKLPSTWNLNLAYTYWGN